MSEESMHSGNDEKAYALKRGGEVVRERVIPEDDEESIERYVKKIPSIVVDEYKKYIDKHKEDDELVKRYPHDYHRSLSVLPMVDKDGKRYLRTIATNEEKTKDFLEFLKEGHFHFENEIIEGVKREEVEKELKRRLDEKTRIMKEKADRAWKKKEGRI